MSAQRTLITADELLDISARLSDEGQRCELVRGELLEMAPAGARHGVVALRIALRIGNYVETRELGYVFAAETGFIIQRNPDTVRAPDVAFVSKERIQGEVPPGYMGIVPDFVVEVVSPSDSASGVQAKVEDWLMVGTRLVWVVYPDTRSVAVYHTLQDAQVLSVTDTLDAEPIFDDFSVLVSDLFK